MSTYPEMNEKIVGLLQVIDSPTAKYAAERIEELEAKVAAQSAVVEAARKVARLQMIEILAEEGSDEELELVKAVDEYEKQVRQ